MFEKMIFEDGKDEEPTGFVVTRNTCNSCGGSFCSSLNDNAKNCVFCGSTSLSTDDYVDSKKYSYIPFIKGIEDAKALFKKKSFWNPLVPFSFKFRKKLPPIQKVFIPAVLVNVNQSGNVVFLGGEKQRITKDRKKCTELKKYEVLQVINVDYNLVPINSTTKISDKVFSNICTYDYDHLQDFSVDVVKDSSYLLGDIPINEIGDKGRGKIVKNTLSMTRDNVNHTLKKLKEDQTSLAFHDSKEVLVPVFLLNIPYRKKNYQFIMNGENGKCYFELPVGILPTIIFSVIVAAIVFALAYYIALKF